MGFSGYVAASDWCRLRPATRCGE
ncbi:hypothetical protein A2U01_0072853, partial [Trifolium medium]|nr:hypothetical protein [Trifolium medium]